MLITAGGSGKRMNTPFPKQFIPVSGRTLLMRTIDVFHEYDPKMKIVLVIPDDYLQLWKELCTEFDFQVEHQLVRGGDERFFSVQNGLQHIPPGSLVLIHDGVRPMVRPDTIKRVIETTEKKGNAVPCVVPAQTIREVQGAESKMLDRNKLRLIQTPQGFISDLIKEAYNQQYSERFTDDASVLESLGHKINLVEGNYSNIKVTHPADIKMVEALLTID